MHRPRSTALCQISAELCDCFARLQGAESAGAEDVASGRNPGYVFVFVPCQQCRSAGSYRFGRAGFAQDYSHFGKPWSGGRPSERVGNPRDRVSEVSHIGCNIMQNKQQCVLDNKTLIFYAVFTLTYSEYGS